MKLVLDFFQLCLDPINQALFMKYMVTNSNNNIFLLLKVHDANSTDVLTVLSNLSPKIDVLIDNRWPLGPQNPRKSYIDLALLNNTLNLVLNIL